MVLLQNGNPDVRKAWNLICDVSRKGKQSWVICDLINVCVRVVRTATGSLITIFCAGNLLFTDIGLLCVCVQLYCERVYSCTVNVCTVDVYSCTVKVCVQLYCGCVCTAVL